MNYKQSKQRQRVLEAVQGKNRHLTADQIYQLVRQQDATIGVATVYRNLNLLCQWNMLGRIKDKDAGYIYDGNANRHYHFLCTQCGMITDAPLEYAEELDELIAEKMGTEVTRHTMTFEGTCKECQSLQKKN